MNVRSVIPKCQKFFFDYKSVFTDRFNVKSCEIKYKPIKKKMYDEPMTPRPHTEQLRHDIVQQIES